MPEPFGIAAGLIAQRTGLAAVFTGDAGEAGLIEQARAQMGGAPVSAAAATMAAASASAFAAGAMSVPLAGALDLGGLAALIAGAERVVSNNTGPAHLAAAIGTPVVALYALTNPQHTPWRARSAMLSHDVPCRNCLKSACPGASASEGHHDCLRRVTPIQVADAALALLAGKGVGSTAGPAAGQRSRPSARG